MIWKLLGVVLINIIIIMGLPMLLSKYEYIAPVTNKYWVITMVTALVICIKSVFGDLISGEFLYHRHGYDFCIATLGATMSMLSLQILSPENLFPGINMLPFAQTFLSHTSSLASLSILYLSLILIIATLCTLLTARISKAITIESPKYPDLLSMINFFLGSGLISSYVLILITRGA